MTKSKGLTSQRTFLSSYGLQNSSKISQRDIDIEIPQHDAYGCLSRAFPVAIPQNRPSPYHDDGINEGAMQMTDSMMKSKFGRSSKYLNNDKSPLYCPDTADKKFD